MSDYWFVHRKDNAIDKFYLIDKKTDRNFKVGSTLDSFLADLGSHLARDRGPITVEEGTFVLPRLWNPNPGSRGYGFVKGLIDAYNGARGYPNVILPTEKYSPDVYLDRGRRIWPAGVNVRHEFPELDGAVIDRGDFERTARELGPPTPDVLALIATFDVPNTWEGLQMRVD